MVLWMASVCCAVMGNQDFTCDMGMGMCNQDAEGRSLGMVNCEEEMSK